MSQSVIMLSIHTSPLDSPGRTKDAGGMNVYMRQLALELGHHNSTVDLFTRRTSETTPQIVYLTKHVRVIHIDAGPCTPIHKNELHPYIPAFTQQVIAFVANEGRHYDVIHSHYWLSGIAAMQLAWRWNIPHITTFHTLARLKQQAHPDEVESPLRLNMEQRLIQQADAIIATTTDERTQLMRYCGATANRVSVIPCGVDLTLFTPQKRSEAREQLGLSVRHPLLLFVGRLDPFKGPDVLLRSAAMMKKDAQVVIAGGRLSGDSDVEQLRTLAQELGIASRVHFVGARPQQELATFYSAADVTVVPSYHESFGMVAVESLACGTPVVATRAGGLTTVVRHGETGYLVPRCPGFFAERLDALLRDHATWECMHAAARPSILQYSWKHVASQVDALYDDVVQANRFVLAL